MTHDWGFITWGLVFGMLGMGYMMVLACWPRKRNREGKIHKGKTAV